MKVVYHVHTYFLDNSIEVINELKKHVELYVFIEVTNESAQSTIIDIDKQLLNGEIRDFKDILHQESWEKIHPYFEGVKACRAIMYRGKNMFSLENIPTVKKIRQEIKNIEPDVVHFDTISNRCFWMYNSLKSSKLVATIHDPIAHSGEGSWKQEMSKMFFERAAKAYFFHSDYAAILYQSSIEKKEKQIFQLGMKPFSIIQRYRKEIHNRHTFILFFGRVSPYKGIDLLLQAIPIILAQYPDEIFMIVGRSDGSRSVQLNQSISKHIKYVDEYVSSEELASFITQSKFVVCPYRDATQSGVLMTSFALNKPVVATNVGSFPEYIQEDMNGTLCSPTTESIANAICMALEGKRYLIWEDNLENAFVKKDSYERIIEYYDTV